MNPDFLKGGPLTKRETGPPIPRWIRLRGIPMRPLERALLVIGLLTLIVPGYLYLEAGLYQAFQSRLLSGAAGSPAEGGSGAGAAPGSVIGRIEIPRLGLSAVIREGIDTRTLMLAVGHVPGTALPGQTGNMVVGGHRDTFFRSLRRIRVDDSIRIVTSGEAFHYRVESTKVIAPERTEVLGPGGGPALTLVTCYPFGFIGPAPKRFIVRARQVGAPRA